MPPYIEHPSPSPLPPTHSHIHLFSDEVILPALQGVYLPLTALATAWGKWLY
jgi:hypothetical protein